MIKWSEFLKVYSLYKIFLVMQFSVLEWLGHYNPFAIHWYLSLHQNHTGFMANYPLLRIQTLIPKKPLWEQSGTNYQHLQVLTSHAARLKKSFSPQMPTRALDTVPSPSPLTCVCSWSRRRSAQAGWASWICRTQLSHCITSAFLTFPLLSAINYALE